MIVRSTVLVFLGAGVGGASRYWLGLWILGWAGKGFPWHTMTINVTGSLLIGLLMGFFGHPGANDDWRLLLVVGLLGGYTTFSSFSYEGAMLLRDGKYLPAFGYAAGSVLLGLLATGLGLMFTHAIRR